MKVKSNMGHETNLPERTRKYIEQKISSKQLRNGIYTFVQWLNNKQ